MAEEPDPIEQLLDAVFYAPLGLALELKDRFPELAERGRAHAAERVPLYETIGRFTVAQAQQKAGEKADGLSDLLDLLGPLVGAQRHTTAADEAPGGAGQPDASAPGDTDERAQPEVQETGADAPHPMSPPAPIDGYDELAAVQIIKLLADLDAEQRAEIRAHELAGRARKTILGKLDQLDRADGRARQRADGSASDER